MHAFDRVPQSGGHNREDSEHGGHPEKALFGWSPFSLYAHVQYIILSLPPTLSFLLGPEKETGLFKDFTH